MEALKLVASSTNVHSIKDPRADKAHLTNPHKAKIKSITTKGKKKNQPTNLFS